jgi:hypothetical protein
VGWKYKPNEETGNEYRILVGILFGKKPFGRRRKWEDKIKNTLRKYCAGVNYIWPRVEYRSGLSVSGVEPLGFITCLFVCLFVCFGY